MSVKKKPVDNIICLNRKASFNFFFEEIVETGIELVGPEVKSLRSWKLAIFHNYSSSEIFLINSYIPQYLQSSYNNHDP